MRIDLVSTCTLCGAKQIMATLDKGHWNSDASDHDFRHAHQHRDFWESEYLAKKKETSPEEWDEVEEETGWDYMRTVIKYEFISEFGDILDTNDSRIYESVVLESFSAEGEYAPYECAPSTQPNSFMNSHLEWAKEENG